MRKAFTFIELIFVVIIVAVLVAIALPKLSKNESDLDIATNQLITHLRYAQHLAVMDDKYKSSDANWWRGRWQVYFEGETVGENRYTVFSDAPTSTGYSGKPNSPYIVAKNPADQRLVLSCKLSGYSTYDDQITDDLCLWKKYGIKNITLSGFSGGVGGTPPRRIAFDELGRPIVRDQSTQDSPYQKNRYLKEQAKITLVHESGSSASICIEPESGYIHRCN